MNTSLPISILCVDDHPMMRMGIASIIEAEPDMQLVAEAQDGEGAMQQYRKHMPDITLMDLRLPDISGIDAAVNILAAFPQARIIMLTSYQGDAQAMQAIRAGASAFLLKSTLIDDLLRITRAVYSGRRCVPLYVAALLAEGADANRLSQRETEMLRLVATGNSNRQVGEILGLAEDTIKAYMKIILSKLNANDRTHAVRLAIEMGYIEVQFSSTFWPR